MKKITLTLFFIFTCFVSFAQVATVKTIRVVNPTTAIGENIPVGTILIDISTNKMYVAKIGIASSETITTSIANLDLKIATSSIVDDLVTGGATVPLSAQQGVALNNLITTSTVAVTDNLLSTVITDALSANQGKILKDLVDLNVTTASIVNDLSTGGATVPLSAQQGVALKTAVDSKVATLSIVNNLTSGGAGVPLSAEQGKTLNDLITTSTVAVTDNLLSTVITDALSANQGKILKDLVDLNVTTASIINDLSTGGTTVPLSAEQGKVLNAIITNKKQSYLHTDTFSETSGTASAHVLTKVVTPTATNAVNFKVSINGGEVLATAITYDSSGNTITLSGITVAQYDVVTVVYTTNE
jgi:hypothetical protein